MIERTSLKRISLLLYFLAAVLQLDAQSTRIISGTIRDMVTKEPLPYVTVFLKKQSIGTLTDEVGRFSILLPKEMIKDSLQVISLGYKDYAVPFDTSITPISLELEPSISELQEVVIRPQGPTYYIKKAMQGMQDIRPLEEYLTEGYYLEKITENNRYLKYDEGIFNSYIPKYKDTLRRQYQLLLYRQGAKVTEMQFMEEERKKLEEKEKKKSKGKNVELKHGIDYVFLSGGPAIMLHYASINKRADDFLDSVEFKNFDYSFAPNTNSTGSEMMIIDFQSKGVVNHVKKSGKIYIHLPTNSILKIEGSGEFIIPVFMRPLMFLYGFSTQELTFKGNKEYQMINGKWYFKTSTVSAKIGVTKKRWFSPNEHANFEGLQKYTVLKIWDQQVRQIDKSKRYDPDKSMAEQVQPEPGRSWAEFDPIIHQ